MPVGLSLKPPSCAVCLFCSQYTQFRLANALSPPPCRYHQAAHRLLEIITSSKALNNHEKNLFVYHFVSLDSESKQGLLNTFLLNLEKPVTRSQYTEARQYYTLLMRYL